MMVLGSMGSGDICIRRAVNHGKATWIADIPASIAKKRIRKFFESESGAIMFADQFRDRITTHGTRSLDLGGLTVSQTLAKFWALREMDGWHRRTGKAILDSFDKAFGGSPMALIGPMDLQMFWSRKAWGPTQRAKVFRYLRLFFNWAERYDLIERNPARRVEPPKVADPNRRILTPEEMESWLAIDDETLRAFLCLGGFAGLRSSEILALRSDDIEDAEIRVNAGTSEERFVKILPAFSRHWRGLPAFPGESAFYRRIRLAIGANLPQNVLRHSYGTYHFSMWEDIGKTAAQLGNLPSTAARHYVRHRRKSAAIAWWSIGDPESGAKVIPMTAVS